MKRIIIAAILSVVAVSAKAQTTYQASNIPFPCDAATLRGDVPLSWSMFACRGIFYKGMNGNNLAELFFWGPSRIELWTPNWMIGPYTASMSLTSFTQPTPQSLGCEKFDTHGNPIGNKVASVDLQNGTFTYLDANGVQRTGTLGTFAYNWSGTDANNAPHSGSTSGTWIEQQVAGGRGCQWFHPFLESAPLTISQ